MGVVVQPAGTVTLVFTDIVGSTRLLSELGPEDYREALGVHRRAVREAFGRHGGYEVDYEGDAFFYAFVTAGEAARAVAEALTALEPGPIRIRVGVHTGEPIVDPPKYVGLDVHRAARIMAAAGSGQVLLSQTTRDLLDDSFVVRDLGEHRLKDMSGPQRLYQLGEGDFPAPKTLYRTNVPVAVTAFLGRVRELQELSTLLGEGVHLLTLTGPAGTGKTRLALQAVAESADSFPDGVWWVPLAPVRDAGLVLSLVAQAVDVREEPGVELERTLAAALTGKRSLLLLDNAEHLLPGCADAVAHLASVPGPTIVVTSRERLQLAGEHVYPVPTLDRPDGVTLFAARAAAVGSEPGPAAVVEQLCARLDDLPLAIELAAARTVVLSPDQILARLAGRLDLLRAARDVDPRQQTLRATIEWSYELLDAEERTLFARFALFAGGCTLEAAESVCDAAIDTLASLIDKSLLRRTGGRYWMLETIREYAAEQLERSPDVELRSRWASHYLELAERAEPELWSSEQKHWLGVLDAEHANVRAVLAWALEHHEDEIALRLSAALEPFWEARGHIDEGQRLMSEALRRGGRKAAAARAKALFGYSRLIGMRSDPLREKEALEEAVELAREAQATRELIFSLTHLGTVVGELGELDRATALHEEALTRARARDDPWLTAMVLNNLGCRLLLLGDSSGAGPLIDESLELRRSLGEQRGIAVTLLSRAELAIVERDYGTAAAALAEALPLAREIGHREIEALALCELGIVRLLENDPAGAGSELAGSLTTWKELGLPERAAPCVAGFAALAQLTGSPRRAARLWGAADALTDAAGTPRPPEARPLYECFLPATRAALDEVTFASEAGAGGRMSFEDVVALAASVHRPVAGDAEAGEPPGG